VSPDRFDTAAQALLELANALAGPTASALDRALMLDALAALAGNLRDDQIRQAKRSHTWAQLGRAFGISQPAAWRRWSS
jgi:hypothetical protein